MSIFDSLTIKQKDAVETIDKNLLILACAGSGKTRVVATRIINILKKCPDVKPENIVAFTYTEKAAGELKTRIYKYAQEELGHTIGFADMFIGTIHGFCLKLLQDYVEGFQAYEILEPIIHKLFVEKYYNFIGMKDLGLKIYKDTKLFIDVMNILNENSITEKMPSNIINVHEKYCQFLTDYKYLDFSLLLKEAYNQIKNNKDLREIISKKIKYLTVDEYQDINPIQEKIIQEIYNLGANVCVVGDDDQTIYQFRGSDADFILKFADKYNNVETITLEENFRSNPGIIDIANTVIKNNSNRFPKNIIAKSLISYQDGDIVYSDFNTLTEEFNFIADRITELKRAGANYSDIAILVRKRKVISELSDILNKRNIPFIVDELNELFLTNEAKAAANIYYYLNKEINEIELKKSLLSIHNSLQEKCVNQIIDYLNSVISKGFYYGNQLNLQQIFHSVLGKFCLYEDDSSSDSSLEVVMYNLAKFSQVINDFETIYYNELANYKLKAFCGFLKYTASDSYSEGLLENRYIKPDGVQLLTVHSAKGLEFPIVFIPCLNKNFFPSRGQADFIWDKIIPRNGIENSSRYETNIEDERKMFYVAVTRAQKLLFLSRSPRNKQENKPSIFYEEAKHSKYIFRYNNSIDYGSKELRKIEKEEPPILFNFSNLQNYFDCPYKFKLSYIYGFAQPIVQQLGYGKSLHDIVMNIHNNYLLYGSSPKEAIPMIVEKCFNMPYANKEIRESMKQKAMRSIEQYYDINFKSFDEIEFVEKDIEIDMGSNVRVAGRIDLVKRKDMEGEKVYIVDFKSSDKAPEEEIKTDQLKIYSAGYKQLTGRNADFIEVYNLDENRLERQQITNDSIEKTMNEIKNAASNLRNNNLCKRHGEGCENCYYIHLCKSKTL